MSSKSSKDALAAKPKTHAFLKKRHRARDELGQYLSSAFVARDAPKAQSDSVDPDLPAYAARDSAIISSVNPAARVPASPSSDSPPSLSLVPLRSIARTPVQAASSIPEGSSRMTPEQVQEVNDRVRRLTEMVSSPVSRLSLDSLSAAASPALASLAARSRESGEDSRFSVSPGSHAPLHPDMVAFMHAMTKKMQEQTEENQYLVRKVAEMEQQQLLYQQSQSAIAVAPASNSQPVAERTVHVQPLVVDAGAVVDIARRDIVDEAKENEDDSYSSRVTDVPPRLVPDSEEAQVFRYEALHPDEEVMMPVDGDIPLEDYVAWSVQRQRWYPYEKYSKLYSQRHTLLSPKGRSREYSRFGFAVGWDSRLFGHAARRWYLRLLHDSGLARPKDGKRPRSISIHQVKEPPMSYDPRDRLCAVRTGEENELPPDSHTFAALPLDLRCDPAAHAAPRHHLSLQEEAEQFIRHRMLLMVAKDEFGDDDDDDDSSSVSSAASYDRRMCSKCDEPVYGLSRFCADHTAEYNSRVDQAVFEAALLDRQTKAKKREQETAAAALTAKHIAKTEVLHIAVPPLEVPRLPSAPPVKTEVIALAAPPRSVVSVSSYVDPSGVGDTPAVYPSDRLKQEQSIRLNRALRDEQDRISSLTTLDQIEESASCLGSILSRAFTPAGRAILRVGKEPARIHQTTAGRLAAIDDLKKQGVVFTGKRMEAPEYLRKLCEVVVRYNFDAGETFQVMQRTMKDQAAQWLTDTWTVCGNLVDTPAKPVEALLDRFMKLYIDSTTRGMFRDAMLALRLPTENATLAELHEHYGKFSKYLGALTMCDRHIIMEDIIAEYVKTLPNSVQDYIGSRYKTMLSVSEVHAEAEACLQNRHYRRVPKQDGDIGAVVSFNAMPDRSQRDKSSRDKSPRSQSPQRPRSYEKQDKRDVVCWHCGEKGHYAGVECDYIDKPQTRRGQAAWAENNKKSYNPRPYDKEYYIQRSRQIQANQSGPANSSTALTVMRPYI